MFYEKLNEIIVVVDSGIYFEMRDFFLSQEFILNCEIKIIEGGYEVLLKGNASSEAFYNKMFFSFVSFVQYSFLTCYARCFVGDNLVYELITANEKMKGFYCKVIIE